MRGLFVNFTGDKLFMTEELTYQIAFASIRGMNRLMADELLARVGDERRFFEASQSQLGAVMGAPNRIFDDRYRAELVERARREVEFVRNHSVKTLYFRSPDYPRRLTEAEDAPLMLYSLGPADLTAGHMLAIVGTRHATPYGCDFVRRLIEELHERLANPLTIVSGLAFGIDAAAHDAALKCGVPTVGVLAHGFQTIYPAQHRSMAASMVRGSGGLLTEYGHEAPIHKGNFVARNRIVAGLCDCLVVAESASKGGALITADLASGYSRDVFALPGRISDRYSAGCNALIASNTAGLITGADDLIRAMGWPEKDAAEVAQPSLFENLSEEEQAIIDYLTEHGEGQINVMTVALNRNIGRLMGQLIDMEFRKLILSYPGGKYRLA